MSESFKAKVIFNNCGAKMATLVLQSPKPISSPSPAQFYLLKAGEFFDPFLRRPLSVSQFEEPNLLTFRFGIKGRGTSWLAQRKKGEEIELEPNLLTFRFGIKGKGTSWLAQRKKGEEIELLGPLGTGFNLKREGHPLLVGGGLGIAPLVYLAQYLLEKEEKVPKVVLGAGTQKDLRGLKVFRRLGLPPQVVTEDGSYGKKGMISDILPAILDRDDEIMACGPRPLLYYLSQIAAKNNLKCQVALEEVMACGVGACLGCVTPVKNGEELVYARVCTEGPVFEASEVVW